MGSQVSSCAGPPHSQRKITDRAGRPQGVEIVVRQDAVLIGVDAGELLLAASLELFLADRTVAVLYLRVEAPVHVVLLSIEGDRD